MTSNVEQGHRKVRDELEFIHTVAPNTGQLNILVMNLHREKHEQGKCLRDYCHYLPTGGPSFITAYTAWIYDSANKFAILVLIALFLVEPQSLIQ